MHLITPSPTEPCPQVVHLLQKLDGDACHKTLARQAGGGGGFRDLWGRRGIPFSCDLWTWEDGSTSSQSYAYTVDVALNLRRQGGVHVFRIV